MKSLSYSGVAKTLLITRLYPITVRIFFCFQSSKPFLNMPLSHAHFQPLLVAEFYGFWKILLCIVMAVLAHGSLAAANATFQPYLLACGPPPSLPRFPQSLCCLFKLLSCFPFTSSKERWVLFHALWISRIKFCRLPDLCGQ